jgi:hypothetical protein
VGVVVKCGATKRDGSPCSLPAQGSNGLCWAHDPANADVRRKGASRGGKSKPGSELAQLKRKLITLGDDVLSGKVDKGKASVAAVCYGTAIKATEAEVKVRELEESRIVETQLRVQEQTELIGRLEAIEESQVAEKPNVGGGGRWGA